MKVLCKKSKIVDSDGNCIHHGQMYNASKDQYGYTITINKKIRHRIGNLNFTEYFFTPEETTSMTRTKLIDAMLYEKEKEK